MSNNDDPTSNDVGQHRRFAVAGAKRSRDGLPLTSEELVVEKTIACLREFTAYCFGNDMGQPTNTIRANTPL